MLDNFDKLRMVLHCLQLFDNYRNDNLKFYDKYFNRLSKYSTSRLNIYSMHGKNRIKSDSKLRSMYFILSKLLKMFFLFIRQIRNFSLYSEQYKRIKRAEQCCKSPGLIICISSRTKIKRGDIRQRLVEVTKVLGGGESLDFMLDVLNQKTSLFLFDPNFESDLWKEYEKIRDQNIFIVDGGFILYLFIRSFFLEVFNHVSKIIFYIKNRTGSKKYAEVAIVFGINHLLKYSGRYKLVLLTSNSTTVEIMRFLSLVDHRCKLIVEIFHGILMNPTERYLHDLCSFESDSHKHVFISQVTNLPNLDILGERYFYSNNLAVNPPFTQFVKDLGRNGNNLVELVQDLSEKLIFELDEGENPIFTVFGGTGHDGDYYNSHSFRFEMMMMMISKEYFRSKGVVLNVIYAAHPANPMTEDLAIYLKNNEVYFTYDSIFCYLVTDFSTSMLSSCALEANWFNIKTYIPMMSSDNLFSSKYLKEVYHPEKDGLESFSESFTKFLDININSKRDIDLDKKIHKRIEKIQIDFSTNL